MFSVLHQTSLSENKAIYCFVIWNKTGFGVWLVWLNLSTNQSSVSGWCGVLQNPLMPPCPTVLWGRKVGPLFRGNPFWDSYSENCWASYRINDVAVLSKYGCVCFSSKSCCPCGPHLAEDAWCWQAPSSRCSPQWSCVLPLYTKYTHLNDRQCFWNILDIYTKSERYILSLCKNYRVYDYYQKVIYWHTKQKHWGHW